MSLNHGPSHLTHGEFSSPAEMALDARLVASSLGTATVTRVQTATAAALGSAFTSSVAVTPAAASIANSMHLHLD